MADKLKIVIFYISYKSDVIERIFKERFIDLNAQFRIKWLTKYSSYLKYRF